MSGKSAKSLGKVPKVRVKLMRVSDALVMSGTVMSLDPKIAVFRMPGYFDVSLGDTFMVEVNGPHSKIVFAARFEFADGDAFSFSVGKDIRFFPTSEPARIAVEGFSCLVRWGEGEYAMGHLLDLSLEGVGIVILDEIPQGTLVEIEIKRKNDQWSAIGDVRYCVELNDGLGHCRLGLRVHHERRVESAKWNALFGRMTDAA